MTTPYYSDSSVTLFHGDCLDVLRELPDNSVDAVVTDPPYGLANTTSAQVAETITHWVSGDRTYIPKGAGFMGRSWDAFVPPAAVWDECLRVLKPGGHALVFAGSRTMDLMTLGLRLAGFEIRDSIAWLYGCLSDDTEILTSDGWVRYDKATTEQHALAFDTATGALEWQQIQHVHRYQHDGEMVRLTSEHTDQLITPNHRVVLDRDGRIPYVPQGVDPSGLCGLRDRVLEAERLVEADQRALLLIPVQRGTAGAGVEGTRTQGPLGLDGRESGVLHSQDDRREQPSLEGRGYRFQEARQLCRSSVRASTGVGAADGPQGRLHHGAPSTDGGDVRLPADPRRSGEPRKPQSTGQPAGELDALAVEPDSQALRVGEDAGRHSLPSTTAAASWVDYAGVVWCITVPHGAFIARRNGLIFATGNSGFPKSLDVSKAIDKAAGAEREIMGLSPANRPNIAAAAAKSGSMENRLHREALLTAPATEAAQQWAGWGTALKPAFEPVVVARKPLAAGTVAGNVLAYGTGALNIDGCRIETTDNLNGGGYSGELRRKEQYTGTDSAPGAVPLSRLNRGIGEFVQPSGRWPANVILDDDQAAALDQMSGELQTGGAGSASDEKVRGTVGPTGLSRDHVRQHAGDRGGASRFFKVAEADQLHHRATAGRAVPGGIGYYCEHCSHAAQDYVEWPCPHAEADPLPLDSLGSRFTYTAKAGSDERITYTKPGEGVQNYHTNSTKRCTKCGRQRVNMGDSACVCPEPDFQVQPGKAGVVAHPTVKPLSLMRWLVRLVTPPGGTILEPFAGSGTTVEAAILEGFNIIAIEREADYLPLITQRIHRRRDPIAYITAAGEDLGLFGPEDDAA